MLDGSVSIFGTKRTSFRYGLTQRKDIFALFKML